MSAVLLLALAALLAAPTPTQAESNAQLDPCSGGGYNPLPVDVVVTSVPIVVDSTTADYFVLYVRHELDAATSVEVPVLVKKGDPGTTTLAENVEALPMERYRVEKYLIADPADIDGDCIDDITELDDMGSQNPVNPAGTTELIDGAVAIPDLSTFDALAYFDRFLKFILLGIDTDRLRLYFVNAGTHVEHASFLEALGIETSSGGVITGFISYHQDVLAPDGSPGLYSYHFQRIAPFSLVARSYTVLAASMGLLQDNLAHFIPSSRLLSYQHELPAYEASRINLLLTEDIAPEPDFTPLNQAEGYGFLRVMTLEDRPNPRDVVIYEALPNELSRVAGIITTVPQTPLSHVNLRAVQDGVPNAFIRDALDEPEIDVLIDRFVHYTVTGSGYTLRAATREEVDNHYASSRPARPQTPERDLSSFTTITPLSEVGFEDWRAFGVKAANVAVLGTLGFPEWTVPDGFAIPFYFYDEFMKHNGFNDDIRDMLAEPLFQTDFDYQEEKLKDLRKAIEKAETPQWIIDAIVEMNESFAEGVNRRYRSSTNNEDLPGFNGAGIYDSKSQKPSEDEDDLAKSLKEVYASLWNFRAFTEREFHRIDHLSAAMGLLVHPSYQDEKVNGVAVSFDPVSGRAGHYYVNSQVGEDLVTNPDALSVPEEGLLTPYDFYTIRATSNQVPPGTLLMTGDQLTQLRQSLTVIHDEFEKLYEPEPGDPFAMEIEFKITSENILAIKQARPWVFESASPSSSQRPTPPPPPPPNRGGGGGGGGGPRQTVPDAPTNLVAEATDGAVTLTWEAPEDDGGSAVTDYQYGINARGWTAIGSTATTHTVTGLVNDTVYVFQVRAVNRIGRSPVSDAAEATPRAAAALDFAHFANGADITSEIVLVNVAPRPIRPALYFYDPEGHLIDPDSVVDVTGDLKVAEDGSLSVLTEMESLGVLTISTHGQGDLVSGSVRVVSEGVIGGMLRFEHPALGVAGVGASPPISDALFPVRRQEGGITTGVALHNLESSPGLLRCDLMREGVLLDAATIPLEANGQTAWLIEDAFTTTDTTDFSGSVRCAATGEGLFTAVALEMDSGNRIFTTLPVLPVIP